MSLGTLSMSNALKGYAIIMVYVSLKGYHRDVNE